MELTDITDGLTDKTDGLTDRTDGLTDVTDRLTDMGGGCSVSVCVRMEWGGRVGGMCGRVWVDCVCVRGWSVGVSGWVESVPVCGWSVWVWGGEVRAFVCGWRARGCVWEE